MAVLDENIDRRLRRLFYSPKHPAGFGRLETLYQHVNSGEDGRGGSASDSNRITRSQIQRWLRAQPAYTLHKPVRYKYSRVKTLVSGIDSQWQADIVDVSNLAKHNDRYRYLLVVIDIFSKYLWVRELKRKSADDVTAAMRDILETGDRQPDKLQTDAGKEFLNRKFQALLKEYDIGFFTTDSDTKSAVVERVNRTLKERMWRYFTAENTYHYRDVLQQLVQGYNHRRHRSIGMPPKDVTSDTEGEVKMRLYGENTSSVESKKPIDFRFGRGDSVRISRARMQFRKGYMPGWSEEIFTIKSRALRDVPVYKIEDYAGEELTGIFYESELQLVDSPDVFKVERILQRRRKKDGSTEYYVKWLGYPEKFNSWVSDLQTL